MQNSGIPPLLDFQPINLTKREQFVMAAMQALIPIYWGDPELKGEILAKIQAVSEAATLQADAVFQEMEDENG